MTMPSASCFTFGFSPPRQEHACHHLYFKSFPFTLPFISPAWRSKYLQHPSNPRLIAHYLVIVLHGAVPQGLPRFCYFPDILRSAFFSPAMWLLTMDAAEDSIDLMLNVTSHIGLCRSPDLWVGYERVRPVQRVQVLGGDRPCQAVPYLAALCLAASLHEGHETVHLGRMDRLHKPCVVHSLLHVTVSRRVSAVGPVLADAGRCRRRVAAILGPSLVVDLPRSACECTRHAAASASQSRDCAVRHGKGHVGPKYPCAALPRLRVIGDCGAHLCSCTDHSAAVPTSRPFVLKLGDHAHRRPHGSEIARPHVVD